MDDKQQNRNICGLSVALLIGVWPVARNRTREFWKIECWRLVVTCINTGMKRSVSIAPRIRYTRRSSWLRVWSRQTRYVRSHLITPHHTSHTSSHTRALDLPHEAHSVLAPLSVLRDRPPRAACNSTKRVGWETLVVSRGGVDRSRALRTTGTSNHG